MATTVHVKNIAAKTDDKEVKDFFSFCGKITNIDLTTEGATKSATVTFEKETAARTALLLNHTKLGDSEISVTSSHPDTDDYATESSHKTQGDRDSDEITQEEKPRTRILAEYLAHGYLVADTGLKTAIALDEKHGVSQRFVNTLQNLDSKYHATDRARTADQSYGLTHRANTLLSGLHSYFEKATNTPTGKRIVDFYTTGQRQVADIHNEARRLAELKKQEHGGSAYKAAGLDKVFGPEKTQPQPSGSGGAPANAPATESAQVPTAPSNVPHNETATQIPKA
ncbi:hypothetical protein QBC46DRAFT_371380 [Diplogelasinospora grovesii]|uniref:RRM domain-containing protein n=1 Tax=Diplogelasinospora grovesii TaxID=303347 RepID=A0AAN6NH45_9PEZI|nr:hypothetical protein QBC46DRAFT_371380 [Diplogelasinospora grovesii]